MFLTKKENVSYKKSTGGVKTEAHFLFCILGKPICKSANQAVKMVPW